MNKRISPKERGLIKGALRRTFSRSDLRRKVVDASRIDHTDDSRPRVKKWSRCPQCRKPTPTYLMEVDHVLPIVPLDTTLENMTWDELINNLWCDEKNLTALCKTCHHDKTAAEKEIRKQNKKGKKKNVK